MSESSSSFSSGSESDSDGESPSILKYEAKWFAEAQAVDHLNKLPDPDHCYVVVDKQGNPQTVFDDRYLCRHREESPGHPKVVEARQCGTSTPQLENYYKGMKHNVNIPIAGYARGDALQRLKSTLYPSSSPREQSSQEMEDDSQSSDENSGDLDDDLTNRHPFGNLLSPHTQQWAENEDSILAFSADPEPRYIFSTTEESFHNRPSIKVPVPDHIKAILVDDWENVTKNQQLVPLPHKHPVDEILNDYLAYERPHRQEGSSSMDVLEEVVAGLREYFDKCLGRILLYRFERAQYREQYELWNAQNSTYKSPLDTYGAEHLCRLIVSLPELIAQTNMDHQSVNKLRDELTTLTAWLGSHATKYFVNEYETPTQEYVDKARNT